MDTENMGTILRAMSIMFKHAENSASDEDLRELSDLTEVAGYEAQRLNDICIGLGLLVGSDGRAKTGMGTFQDPESVSDLLFFLASSFDHISAMVRIGTGASATLNQRAKRAQKGKS